MTEIYEGITRERDQLRAKVAELEKGAARYRFLREKVFFNEDGCYFAGGIWSALDKHNEAIKTDNAIDQAMKDSD